MERTERRKLQALGGSVYLSLPSSWTRQYHLKKGSEIILQAKESGELSLFPQEMQEEKEQTSVILYNNYLFRNLMGAYLRGTDLIRVKKESGKAFSKAERE